MSSSTNAATAFSTNEVNSTPNQLISANNLSVYIPTCPDEKKPKIGQIFDTLKEGEDFYKDYAAACGFTSRLATTRRPSGRAPNNEFLFRIILCNRAGVKPEKKRKLTDLLETSVETKVSSETRARLITRINCDALMKLTRIEFGKYTVTSFVEEHNHPLASPESTMFLKGNRTMTSVQKTFVAKAARLKLGGVKAFRGWKELSGGYGNVGATEVDFKNFVRDMKSYIGDFDGQMFVENFIRKKNTCSSFYFDFEIDEQSRLSRVFWSDPISIKNYNLFGEMCSVDATYNTNKYSMVFVPFTGVDHHKRCVTFGAGLLAHEDTDSYTWLFKTFLDAMGGCQPKVLITDQDPAMKLSVAEVFPETTHRLCMWHIMKKLREKVSAQLWQDDEFKSRLNRCVWNNQLEPEEFETEWNEIMTKHDLQDNSWFLYLYGIRQKWIPAYFKDIFMGGLMRVTSRSESENSFFDRFVTPHVTLVEFWMCFESAMDAQRHKQSKLNSDNKHSQPQLKTPLCIETHASEIYTHNIFRDFQAEFFAAIYKCGMKDMNKIDGTQVFVITDSDIQDKTWKVLYSSDDDIQINCSCCLFQRLGLLCRHCLWVLHSKKIQKIPEKYIVHRWTKGAMNKPVFDRNGELIQIAADTLSDKKKLTTELWEEVYSCVSLAEDNDDDMKCLIEKLRDIKIDMARKRSIMSNKKDKKKEMEKYVGCKIPEKVLIQPPKRSKNKGSGKRIESQVIKAIEQQRKQKRYCKTCGRQGHNSRTCQVANYLTGMNYLNIITNKNCFI